MTRFFQASLCGPAKRHSPRFSAGQVTLPFVLVIGSIMIAMITAIVFVSVLESGSIAQERAVSTGRFLLETGLQDALLKVARDKSYNNTSGYVLTINDGTTNVGTVTIKVYVNTPSAGKSRILLTAQPNSLLSTSKTAEAVISVDSTGEISIDYFNEL